MSRNSITMIKNDTRVLLPQTLGLRLRYDVPVDDRRSTTSNHSPDTTVLVEHGELERSTGTTIQFLDVSLLLCQVPTPWRWPDYEWCGT